MYDQKPFTAPSRPSSYDAERVKLLLRKLFGAIVFLLLLLSPVLYIAIQEMHAEEKPLPATPELVSHEVSILEEYEYIEECYCEISLIFNRPVQTGNMTVAFYDEAGELIESRYISFYANADDNYKTADATVFVSGMVDSYEIVDITFDPYDEVEYETDYTLLYIYWLLFICSLPITIPFFWLRVFACNCKEFEIDGQRVLVYAGHLHFYIKVDGEKYDEIVHCALFSATRLHTVLDCDLPIDVTISAGLKRIRLKFNDRLIEPIR